MNVKCPYCGKPAYRLAIGLCCSSCQWREVDDQAAARARWSERNQVVLRILAGGACMRARYQKSEESCERMRQAQMGNSNRRSGE
jgi:hypothetical protein